MSGGSIDTDVDGAVAKANSYLTDALQMGLPYSERFTQQAIDALNKAQEKAQSQLEQGFQRNQALNAPYRLAGYTALDSYMDTLSMARPEMGSYKLATALENTADREAALKELGQDVSDVRKYQNIGDVGEYDENGNYVPGLYAENMSAMAKNMLANNWFPSQNTSQGYVPLKGLQGGYLVPGTYGYGGTAGAGTGSIPSASLPPMTASEQTRRTIMDLGNAMNDFRQSTQYYTPEQGGIAASFNKGMLGPTQWVNVNQPVLDPATGRYTVMNQQAAVPKGVL